MTIQYIAGPRS